MATTAATHANPFDLAGKVALVTGSTMGIAAGAFWGREAVQARLPRKSNLEGR
jgi:hypothetical protein